MGRKYWLAYCEDVDCWSCSPQRGKEIMVSSPDFWDMNFVVRQLQIKDYRCNEGNRFYGAEAIDGEWDAEIIL